MSFVLAAPEALTAAATDVARIGSAITGANGAAAASITEVAAAGADEVSAQLAALFGAHARAYQAVSAQTAAFHDRFVQALNAGGCSYAGTEAANASPMRDLLTVGHAPAQASGGAGTSPAADADFISKTMHLGPISDTAAADPDDGYIAKVISIPHIGTDILTSGADPSGSLGFGATGVGIPGETVNTFESTAFPFLNSTFTIPFTDPFAALYIWLIPLGLAY